MKQLMSFVRKEFYHIFRDKTTVLILLGIPVIQMILFGFALTTEVKNTQIVVLAPAYDEVSDKIIQKLDNSQYFNVAGRINSSSEIESVFKSDEAKLIVVFENDFGKNLIHNGKAHIQLIADATDANAATTFTFYASNIINDYQLQLSGSNSGAYRINPEVRMLYNPQMISAFNFVPGVLGMILILICAMMTSIAIVREKEKGTMEILLVSPMKPIYSILSKLAPYFVLSCINFASIILLSVYVLDVPVVGHLGTLIFVSLLYIIVSLSIGMLISTLVTTQLAAMLISGMGLMLPVMLLSGMIFPVENMPEWLQFISNVIPARWYIEAVKSVMIQGLGFTDIVKEMSILTFMAVVLILVSLKKYKVRLE